MKLDFKNSFRLVWFTLLSAIGLQIYAVEKMGSEAAPILVTTLPTMLGLVAAWTHVTNKRETDYQGTQ